MMLAGFDENGNPLVHDPAKSNGYGYKFNKAKLDSSWFDKGGISYTFYLEDSVNTAIEIFDSEAAVQLRSYRYISNYPNPFNNSTNISFQVEQSTNVEISIYNINGEKVTTLANKNYSPGKYVLQWNGTYKNGRVLGSGIYFFVLKTESGSSYYSPMHFVK